MRDVTCKPSTHSKNQDNGLKTKRWQHSLHHMYDSTNCAASAWFLNQDLGFFEEVFGLKVSVETGESAQPLTTAITDQLMTQ